MTPSSFGYSICFAALFASIGLIVGPYSKTAKSVPLSSDISCLYGEVDIAVAVKEYDKAVTKYPLMPLTGSQLKKLWEDLDTAFVAEDYATAVTKIEDLLKFHGPNKATPPEILELLYFNLGLANLLGGKNVEAEVGFVEYLKRFPKGQFASRSFIGIGRAAIAQNNPEKKKIAIKALKIAALDPEYRAEAGLWLDRCGK